MQIQIPYKPRTWAKELHASKKRWNVVVAHRRCGKTVASLNHLIRSALTTPKSRFAYIAPTYKQAKGVAWDILKEYTSTVPRTKFNEAELRADFGNGSRITLYGAENVDGLRGIGLWGVVFDEYSQQPSNIFSEVISKCLADHYGYAIWIGTPKGKNEFYRIFNTAKEQDDWLAVRKTIDESIDHEEGEVIDNLKLALEDDKKLVEGGVMTEDEFQQEWYCSFEVALKGAYYAEQIAQLRDTHRFRPVPHESILGVTTAWDLGYGDSTAIGFFQMVGGEIRMIDYYEDTGKGLDHYIKVVREKPYIYDRHFAPHDIAVHEFSTGKTRLEFAEELGIDFEISDKSVKFDDGINSVRAMFSKLYINSESEQCTDFLDKLSQYSKEWDEKRGEFKKTAKHNFTSHAADMLRYFAISIPNHLNTQKDEDDFEDNSTDY